MIYLGFGIGSIVGSIVASLFGGFLATFHLILALLIVALLFSLTIRQPGSSKEAEFEAEPHLGRPDSRAARRNAPFWGRCC